MRALNRLSCAVLLAVAVAAAPACQTAQPYLDPQGPLYVGSFAGTSAAAPEAPAPMLRIVTFNVEYALKVDRALAALREHPQLKGTDIIALQEMDEPGTVALARGLGFDYAYCPASVHPKYHRDVGNAILSRWPLSDVVKVPLPHRSRVLGQSRVAVMAVVTVAGRRLRVYALHLGSPFGASPGQRRDQIDVVLRHAEGSPDPVVIAGDFNSKGLGERLVARGYAWPTRDVGATTHGQSFDHVFVKGLQSAAMRAGVVREVTDASDHRPVWVEIVAAPASE
jgi:endonuclease/exonuclease/phosphatase family metal-dependent hydrolase